MRDLVTLFDGLGTVASPSTDGGEAFSGLPLGNTGALHLAKDTAARPVLMFRLPASGRRAQLPNIALENLRVENGLLCRIWNTEGNVAADRFTVMRCLSSDRQLQEYFLRTLDGVVRALADPVDPQTAIRIVNSLAQLFQALKRPATGSVIGLWAELLAITCAHDPSMMLRAWHAELPDRYDFSFDDLRIEVKASGDGTRRHHFSFQQTHPPDGITVIVASMIVEHSTNGTSLGHLWDEVHALVEHDADLLMKLERICIETLGETWHAARDTQFDRQQAKQSLMVYDIAEIPNIPSDVPEGVSEIIFRSDVARATQIDRHACAERGVLFEGFLGTR